MGRANKKIAEWADVVCLGMPGTAAGNREVFTGNPIRQEMTQGKREEGLRLTGFLGNRPILLVIGGSQGAETINRIVIDLLPHLLRYCDVAHVTGTGKSAAKAQPGYWSAAILHEEYPHLFAAAALALSRSGAGSIGDLAGNGIPTLLVPLEDVAQNHQTANALAAVKSGGCLLLPQRELKETLISTVQNLVTDEAKRKEMGRNFRTLWNPHAAEDIAKILLQAGSGNGGAKNS
jgi:UDP-N-acetylglucosamine--N-acetylmuramyl-(pentapeptide) pyrophosphoryl-undecaprenol N-acetylglucosamine transferase